ncbi:hypothetical protein D029_2085B, partial [Vibrio parahaemolyticus 970107]
LQRITLLVMVLKKLLQ